MFSLLFGRRQKEQVQLKKRERPQPHKITVSDSTREALVEYEKMSVRVGYKPAQVRQEELILFLADNNIPVYEGEQVHNYLVSQAEDQNKCYVWIPLRKEDKNWNCESLGRTLAENGYELHGNIMSNWGPYSKIVPLSVMETIAKIKAAFPDAHFYVSEITDIADPFLAVAIAQCQLLVIDFWNEPSFRPVQPH